MIIRIERNPMVDFNELRTIDILKIIADTRIEVSGTFLVKTTLFVRRWTEIQSLRNNYDVIGVKKTFREYCAQIIQFISKKKTQYPRAILLQCFIAPVLNC